jgi:hypothetical protein
MKNSGIEDPDMNPHSYAHIIFDKETKMPCVAILNKQKYHFFFLLQIGKQESRTDPAQRG